MVFDYPSPWGQPLRAERTVGLPVVHADGVRVDPANPRDVTLGRAAHVRSGVT